MLTRFTLVMVGLAASALAVSRAGATIVTYNVNAPFSGAQSGGTAPYVQLTFDDQIAPGSVRMTANAPGLEAAEWVARIDLNMDPALDVTQLTFSNFQILTGTLLQPLAFLNANAFEADAGGFFDWELQFAVSGGGQTRRFNQGESFSFDLGGIAGLNANSFNFPSAPPATNGPQLLSVLIQNIGPDALEGFHTVPEPGSGSVVLLAFGIVALRRRREPRT
jgi:hypothetical protein